MIQRLFLLCLLLPTLAFGFPANPVVLDTFTGNAQPIGGIWSDDLWVIGLGCEKVGGYATKDAGTGTSVGCWVTAPFGALQEVYAEIFDYATWSDSITSSILLCVDNPGVVTTTGYALRFQKQAGVTIDDVEFAEFDGQVFTQIGADIDFEAATGDDLGAETTGVGTFDIWIKDGAAAWGNVASRVDTSTPYDCTNTHIGFNFRSSVARFDNLGGGSTAIPVAAGNPFIRLLLR